LAAAQTLGAVAVKYPQPAEKEPASQEENFESGIRVGIVSREQDDEAWQVANARFPGDRQGQLTHQLAMKISDSAWHKQLSSMAKQAKNGNGCYWLWPFENYKTFCPYLVGSYDVVAAELAKYIEHGYRTFILDIPPSREELEHIKRVFSRAQELVAK
jgi:alkanesulfonate monooxygenase